MKLISACWLTFCTLLITGCSNSGSSTATTGSADQAVSTGSRIKLQGSGASFPAPLYLKWFNDYEKKNSSVLVDYQAKGSGAGIQDLANETVDFAASDAAMTPEEIAKVQRGVVLLPLTAGEIVLTYNLPNGPSDLKLSREAYCRILMGQITKWNDPAIAASNPGTTLPDTAITVVVRSDSSGTTYVLSAHLSSINSAWKEQFGINKTINWPSVSHIVKAPKNDGVMALVKQTPGAIGYVEFGFAQLAKQPMAVLENKSGAYVQATAQSGKAALASVTDIPDDLILWVTDPAGNDSYPIVTYTWLLCYRKYDDPRKAEAIRNLIEYCVVDGQTSSEPIGYIPLPEIMVDRVKTASAQIQ
jgi:phosphate transport system substrate-binding protein